MSEFIREAFESLSKTNDPKEAIFVLILGAYCAILLIIALTMLFFSSIIWIYEGVQRYKENKIEKARVKKWLDEHPVRVPLEISRYNFDDKEQYLTVYAVNGEKAVYDKKKENVFLPEGEVLLRIGRIESDYVLRRKKAGTYGKITRSGQMVGQISSIIKSYKKMFGKIPPEDPNRFLQYGIPIELTVSTECQYVAKVDRYDNEIHIIVIKGDKSTVLEFEADCDLSTPAERERRERYEKTYGNGKSNEQNENQSEK